MKISRMFLLENFPLFFFIIPAITHEFSVAEDRDSDSLTLSTNSRCELGDAFCNYGNNGMQWYDDIYKPIGVMPTVPLKVYIPGKQELIKDKELILTCLGEDNKFSLGKNGNPMLRSLEHLPYVRLSCRCGQLFRYACYVCDTNKLRCKNAHRGNVLDKRETIEVPTSNGLSERLLVLRAGFDILGEFHEELRILFDEHSVTPRSAEFKWRQLGYKPKRDREVDRNLIDYGHTYNFIDVKKAYRIDEQKWSFNEQRNYNYVNDDIHFVPGYLAPANSLSYIFGHISSNFYVNTAPQWNKINEGNWRITTDFLHSLRHYDTVVVGTHGYLKLDINSNFRNSLYLYSNPDDAFNKFGKLSIPLIFVLLVHDGQSCSTAFVTFNNPYANEEYIKENIDQICKIHTMASYPLWNYAKIDSKYRNGFSFYCNGKDFIETTHFPVEDQSFKNYKNNFSILRSRAWIL